MEQAIQAFVGQLLHEPDRIRTGAGKAFKVFTPFWNAMLRRGAMREPVPAPPSLPWMRSTSFWKCRGRTAFGAVARVGAFAGARLAVFLSGAVQLAILGIVMLAAAASMFRAGARDATRAATAPHASGPGGDMAPGLLVPVALGVGVLTGIVGIGGGFLVVPALVLLARVPMRQAVGTSLLVIAMKSFAGLAGYLTTVQLDWPLVLAVTAAAVAGSLVGGRLAGRVPEVALRKGFGWFVLVMGSFVQMVVRAGERSGLVTASTSCPPAARCSSTARRLGWMGCCSWMRRQVSSAGVPLGITSLTKRPITSIPCRFSSNTRLVIASVAEGWMR